MGSVAGSWIKGTLPCRSLVCKILSDFAPARNVSCSSPKVPKCGPWSFCTLAARDQKPGGGPQVRRGLTGNGSSCERRRREASDQVSSSQHPAAAC